MDGAAPLSPTVLASLRIPATAGPAAADLLKALVGQTLEATLGSAGPDGVRLLLANGKELTARGDLPFPAGSALALKAVPLPSGAGIQLQVVRATPPPASPVLQPLAQGEAAPLLARLLQSPASALQPLAALFRALSGGTAAEEPDAWATWLKEAFQSLADPAASPDEAAFHRLQGQEDSGWFEVPLPWAAGAEPLRLWVEADRDSGEDAGSEPVHRVFLSVPFTELGDVRVGLEQRAAGLRAKVWLSDPAQLESGRAALEAELGALGRPVDLRILPLPPQAPDLRAMAGGASLSALG
ncbi:hypothetical protein [Geothrix sp. 21YS21S-4]|uniref:hypothetical protein n=1 Tax=Geothrix sp. 21YS21S-4 TaxID=3068889 RepID=UPI0027BA47B7|nr:hypothetical protein [Geothrix sp. 21YS21S-4]